MANPVLRGIITFQDRASVVLNRIRQSHDLLNRSMVQAQAIGARGLEQSRRTIAAVGNYNRGLKEISERTQAATRHTRDMHITLGGMLKVMAMFAINLQIIRAATSPFTFLRGAIEQSAAFQEEMQGINALLRVSDEELQVLGLGIRRVAGDFGIATADVLASAKQIASSVSALNLGPLSEQEAVLNLLRAAARGAVIDNSSLSESVDALRAVMAGLNFEMSMSDKVMARMFALVDVGDISFAQLSQSVGDFMGTLAAIAPSDPLKRLAFTEDIFAIFAQLTNVQPVSEASTAVNRFLISVIKEAKGTEKIRQELERVTGIPLGLNILAEKGPLQFLNNIIEAIGRESPLVKEFIEGQREILEGIEPISAQEFERITLSSKLASKLFPNQRALRPFLILAQAGGEQVNKIYADSLESIGKFNEAQEQAMDNLNRQLGRLRELWNSFKIVLADPLIQEATSFIRDMAEAVSSVVNAAGFQDLSTGDKISSTLNAVINQLDRWWESGGREKINAFADNFAIALVIFLNDAVISNMDKFIEVGTAMASGIVKGLMDYIRDPSNYANPFIIGSLIGLRAGGPRGALAGGLAASVFTNESANVARGEGGLTGLIQSGLIFAGTSLLLNKFGGGAARLFNRSPVPGTKVRLPAGTIDPATGKGIGGRFAGLAPTLPLMARVRGAFGRATGVAGIGLLANFLLSGPGPLRDQGGVFGLVGSIFKDSPGPEPTNGFDLSSFLTATAIGAATGGGIASLIPIPFISTLGGALIGGGLAAFGALRQQGLFGGGGGGADRSPSSGFSGLGIQERSIMNAFGITNYPPGIIQPMLQNALAAGITDPNDLMRYIAFNLATIQEESGFGDIIVSDPTSKDPSARSGGLYQLNTAITGQGYGMSDSQLRNPITNTRVGSKRIADLFRQYGGDFFTFAQKTGHPGVSSKPQAVAFSNVIASRASEYLSNANNSNLFATIATGGVSGVSAAGGISITVEGDLVITGVQNPEELAEQLAGELFNVGAGGNEP